MAASSAGIRASFISPSASGADWASPPRRRSMWCGWMPPAAASWSDRARRCGWIASCCATSTGSATARSIARSARVLRFSCGCDRPARRSRHGCARPMAAMKSNWSPAKRAYRPARPACSTMRRQGQARVLGGGFIQSATAKSADAAKGAIATPAAGRGDARIRFSGRGHGCRYRPRGGRKGLWALGAGLRSGVRQGFRSPAASRPSRRPTGSAAGFSMSASAPDCRCRIIRRTTKLCGVDISEPMLRKAQQRVRALGLGNVETLAVMDAKNLAFRGFVFRRGGGAICHHRGAGSRSHAR